MRLDYGSNPSRPGERSTRGDDPKGRRAVRIGSRWIGAGYPTYVIADIATNHDGDLNVARALIDAAAAAGCDAVKFQKRASGPCELDREEYGVIDRHCRARALGTGMSTMAEIERSVMAAGTECLLIAHSSGALPCPVERLKLRLIRTLQVHYPDGGSRDRLRRHAGCARRRLRRAPDHARSRGVGLRAATHRAGRAGARDPRGRSRAR